MGPKREQDVSARSPISHDAPQRQSLDSARFPRLPRAAMDRKAERPLATAEETFEDIGLDDNHKHQQPAPRRRGFFSKFSDDKDKDGSGQGGTTVSRLLMSGRKRGQSGQGAELGHIERPKLVVTSDQDVN